MVANCFETDGAFPSSVETLHDAAGQSLLVSVKNTFIHVEAHFASSRRCASMPSLLQKAPTSVEVVMLSEDEAASTDSESMEGLLAGAKRSPISTATGSPRATGSPLDSSSNATGSPCYTPRTDTRHAAEWPPCAPMLPPPLVTLPPEVMMPPPVEAPAVGPPRLKSSAMPYQPRVVLPGGPNTPQNIHLARAEAIMRVATAAITALMAHPAVQGAVRVLEDHTGWACQVEVLHPGAHALNEVLECAKANLLEAAGSSNDIYVMGYEATPFQTKPDGFEATLGVMQDESQACWDSYTSGSCCRGVRCRWQHPTCLKRFAVTAWSSQNT